MTNHYLFRPGVAFGVVDGMLLAQVAVASSFLFSKMRVLKVASTLLYGFGLFLTAAMIHL